MNVFYKQNFNYFVLEKPVSIIIPVQGQRDKFVVSLEREISILTWDGRTGKISDLQTLAEVDKDTENRLNDGKCDPKGRLWTGNVFLVLLVSRRIGT